MQFVPTRGAGDHPHPASHDDGCSLRTRKREDTRAALTEAAYALVRDARFEALTAEAVADRAGVSRRTFFNYFPSVESVLTASVTEFFVPVGERLDARPRDEDVLDSALAVVTDPGDSDLVERIAVLAAAGEASPHARGLILVELHSWLDWLEGWLRGRLPAGSHRPARRDLRLHARRRRRGRVPRVGARWTAAPPTRPVRAGHLAAAIGHLRAGLDPARPAPEHRPPRPATTPRRPSPPDLSLPS